jgi:putative Holliday junction resolvase
VAVCDAARTVATPLTTLARMGDRRREHEAIAALAAEHDATLVVVGLPLSLSGEQGPAARAVRSEVAGLRRRLPGIQVAVHDERLSTVTAQRSLRAGGVDGRRGRAVVDQLAAAVILQSYLDATRP